MIKTLFGIILGIIFVGFSVLFTFHLSPPAAYDLSSPPTFSIALWEFRPLDVFLQLLIILAGTFGILHLIGRPGQ